MFGVAWLVRNTFHLQNRFPNNIWYADSAVTTALRIGFMRAFASMLARIIRNVIADAVRERKATGTPGRLPTLKRRWVVRVISISVLRPLPCLASCSGSNRA